MFNLALDLARPRDSRAYPAKFSGHGHCASGDIMVLVYHVISELVTCNLWVGVSWQVTASPSLVAISIAVVEILTFLQIP